MGNVGVPTQGGNVPGESEMQGYRCPILLREGEISAAAKLLWFYERRLFLQPLRDVVYNRSELNLMRSIACLI